MCGSVGHGRIGLPGKLDVLLQSRPARPGSPSSLIRPCPIKEYLRKVKLLLRQSHT